MADLAVAEVAEAETEKSHKKIPHCSTKFNVDKILVKLSDTFFSFCFLLYRASVGVRRSCSDRDEKRDNEGDGHVKPALQPGGERGPRHGVVQGRSAAHSRVQVQHQTVPTHRPQNTQYRCDLLLKAQLIEAKAKVNVSLGMYT